MSTGSDLSRVQAAKEKKQQVVAVLGLGFVGTAVVANLARTKQNNAPLFYVVGIDQDNPMGRERASRLNQGLAPVYANDESLETVISEAFKSSNNLMGTVDMAALALADVVVVCINLDLQREPGQTEKLKMNVEGYASAMRAVGERIQPGTLVAVESTLPLGACDTILYPALCEGQKAQGINIEKQPPLLAFCYERVMPGPGYLDSVNNFWRAYAGINSESAARARAFLTQFVNTKDFPLFEHKHTRAAEMSKLLENSYRAMNIAFIEEWSKLAEDAGVNLFDVVTSIRMRKGTHDNMMRPGLGVGGYCLTKDALLAAYGAEQILKIPAELPFSRRAILTNEKMPLRAVEWIQSHFNSNLNGKQALLLGVTYREGVGDTRSSSSEIVARRLKELGVTVTAYDPLVSHWDEFPEITVEQNPMVAATGAEIVVVCLPDQAYKKFLPELLTTKLAKGSIVVDPWNMVGAEVIGDLQGMGITLKVYGRGDI